MMIRTFALLTAIAAIVLGTSGARSQNINSSKDPYFCEPEQRINAETKTPWGVILDARYAVYAGMNIGPSPGFMGGADLYYDTWQAGFHMEDYGNVLRFGPRSVGRDWSSGWFVDFGSGSSLVEDSSTKVPGTLYGFGYTYLWSFNFNSYQAGGGFTMKFGFNSHDGGHYGPKDSLAYPSRADGYFVAQYSMQWRIPVQTQAVTFGVDVFGEFLPVASEWANYAGWGVRLRGGYAFNFEN